MLRLFLLFLVCAGLCAAQGVTYVVLWFDTEDYVDPIADDAALRIANDLTRLGVRGTFKVVGEKARVLEARNRRDVIQALGRHSIGYHSDWHSIQPVPALDRARLRRRGPALLQNGRRLDQHLLSPHRVRSHRILGRGQFRKRRNA